MSGNCKNRRIKGKRSCNNTTFAFYHGGIEPLERAVRHAAKILEQEYIEAIYGSKSDIVLAIDALRSIVRNLREDARRMAILPDRTEQVPGFTNYCAHRNGTVYSRNVFGSKGKKVGPWWKMHPVNNKGRPRLTLYTSQRKYRSFFVSQIIMLTFVGPQPEGSHTRHLNGNPWDNRLSNLQYGTPKENQLDSVRHGTFHHGEMCSNAKLKNHQIPEIRRRLAAGEKEVDIAKDYNISQGAIACIATGRTWKDF